MSPLQELSREVADSLTREEKDIHATSLELLWSILVVLGLATLLAVVALRQARKQGIFYGERPAAFSLLTILALLSSLFWTIQINAEAGYLNDRQEKRFRAYVLADGLGQGINDLTDMVRLYALTGDTLYRDYFDEILAIRNGDLPRPVNYFEIPYWDIVLATGDYPVAAGEAMPVSALAREEGFGDVELGLLEEAERMAASLVRFDNQVLATVEEQRRAGGEYRLEGDVLLATQRLHGLEHHQAMEAAMRPLADLSREIEEGFNRERSHSLERLEQFIVALLMSIAFAILLSIIAMLAWHILYRHSWRLTAV